jgi:hypothetical protein
LKKDPYLASGTITKKEGWRVSKYKASGDKYPTLKVRKVNKR